MADQDFVEGRKRKRLAVDAAGQALQLLRVQLTGEELVEDLGERSRCGRAEKAD